MKTILAVLLVWCLASTASAQTCQLNFTWDPSPSQDVTEYSLEWGTASRVYTNSVTVVGTKHPVTVESGVIYFFSVRARNAQGLISGYSNEVQIGENCETLSTGEPGGQLRRPQPITGVVAYIIH